MRNLTTTTQEAKKQVFNLLFMGWNPKKNEVKLVKKQSDSCYLEFVFDVTIQSPCNSLESCNWTVTVLFDVFDGDFKTFIYQNANKIN